MNQISFKRLWAVAFMLTIGTVGYHYFFRKLPDWMTVMDICFGMFSLIANAWILTKLGFFDDETVEDILENSNEVHPE